mgnify:CR=1 FL=1
MLFSFKSAELHMLEEPQKELVKQLAVPVYEDTLKSFGVEISKGLVSIARSVNTGTVSYTHLTLPTTPYV